MSSEQRPEEEKIIRYTGIWGRSIWEDGKVILKALKWKEASVV